MTTATSRRYRIVVRGRLSERFADGFADLRVERGEDRTALTGVFPDASSLHGLLGLLHDMRIELVSVDALD